jgi:hypothetical protein
MRSSSNNISKAVSHHAESNQETKKSYLCSGTLAVGREKSSYADKRKIVISV